MMLTKKLPRTWYTKNEDCNQQSKQSLSQAERRVLIASRNEWDKLNLKSDSDLLALALVVFGRE